jgi:hypothetical protein
LVAAALKASGADFQLAATYVDSSAASGDAKQLETLFGELQDTGSFYSFSSDLSAETGQIMASAAGTSAVVDLAKALSSGTEGDVGRAKFKLRQANVSASDIRKMEAKLRENTGLASQIVSAAPAYEKEVGRARVNRSLRASVGVLRGASRDLATDESSRTAAAQEFAKYSDDPSKLLLDLVSGKIEKDSYVGKSLEMTYGDSALDIATVSTSDSTADIVKKYFGDNTAMAAQINEARNAAGSDVASFRKQLGGLMLKQAETADADPRSSDRKAAEALENAAIILERLMAKPQ